ncbi:MAG: glycosyltransferase [Cellvibrionaceae bacterium]|nr:glycosyltransferase [Cellvibrionaceae bacterium]
MNSFFGHIYSRYGHHFSIARIYEKGYFSRPFGRDTKNLLMLYCPKNPVSFSQIYPFFFYEKQIKEQFGIAIRAVPVDQCLASDLLGKADVIGVQTEFAVTDDYFDKLFADIRSRNSKAPMVYFDWYAPLDLRFAAKVNPHVDLYVKRQVFRDHRRYHMPTLGDTNLVDYYSRLHNIAGEEQHFPVPKDFFRKIVLGPGLLTGYYMLNAFAKRQDLSQPKTLTLHARFACSGSPWYSAMRNDALHACQQLPEAEVKYGSGVSKKEFLAEMARSKMCFSPFGYGEVCWRDYEAALYGSLLLKPDMDHLKTSPDIFIKDETYVAIAWDYSDLKEKVEFYSNNNRERDRIVANARQALDDYVNKGGFIRQMTPIFQLAHGQLPQLERLYENLATSDEQLTQVYS